MYEWTEQGVYFSSGSIRFSLAIFNLDLLKIMPRRSVIGHYFYKKKPFKIFPALKFCHVSIVENIKCLTVTRAIS